MGTIRYVYTLVSSGVDRLPYKFPDVSISKLAAGKTVGQIAGHIQWYAKVSEPLVKSRFF